MPRNQSRTARPRRKPGKSLPAEVARRIGAGILDGTYLPGTLLPNEAEWGAMFGVSRTAVREAIKTLIGKGLLISRPKIGSRVLARENWNLLDRDVLAWHSAAMDPPTLLASIQEVRKIIEPGAAALAAAKHTPDQLARLRAALDGMAAARTAGEMIAPDVAFHRALLECSNNELLRPLGILIEQALEQMFEYTSRHNPKPMGVIPLHQEVYEAIAACDSARAWSAVTSLLADTDQIIARR